MSTWNDELWQLLEALCEDRLSAEGVLRLEQIVLSSKEARQFYIRYMDLHGSLYWDAAFGAREEEVCPTTEEYAHHSTASFLAASPENIVDAPQVEKLPDEMTWEQFSEFISQNLPEHELQDVAFAGVDSRRPEDKGYLWQELPSKLTAVKSMPAESTTDEISAVSRVPGFSSLAGWMSPRQKSGRKKLRNKWSRYTQSVMAAAVVLVMAGFVTFPWQRMNELSGNPLVNLWKHAVGLDDSQSGIPQGSGEGSLAASGQSALPVLDAEHQFENSPPTNATRSPGRLPVALPLSVLDKPTTESTSPVTDELIAQRAKDLKEQQTIAEEAARIRSLSESVSAFVKSPSKPTLTLVYPQGRLSSSQVVAQVNDYLSRTWKAQNLTPAPMASEAAWHRRIYLDLVGHIPTSAETEDYLADRSPGRRERLVDRLLDDPGFARHLATTWTNLLVGRLELENADRHALYEYLRVSFAGHRPWNRIVEELVSASGRSHENGATNFLLANMNHEALAATTKTARLFLGQSLDCVQCHQHPFDDVRQAKFWELNSFFRQAGSRPILVLDKQSGKKVQVAHELFDLPVAGPVYFEMSNQTSLAAFPRWAGQEVDDSAATHRRTELGRILAEDRDQQLARAFVNRFWSQLFGQGFTTPVDDMGVHQPPVHSELLELLTRSFVQDGYSIRELTRCLVNSRPYQLASVRNDEFVSSHNMHGADSAPAIRPDGFAFQYMMPKPLSPEQVFDSFLIMKSPVPGQQQFWVEAAEQRQKWIEPLIQRLATEENVETNVFSTPWQEFLTLMNGELTQELLSAQSGTLLSEILKRHRKEVDQANAITMAIVSRKATENELAMLRASWSKIPMNSKGSENSQSMILDLWRDFAWALLNSTEFRMTN